MMKKMCVSLIIVLSLTVFGTVSSVHAFIDPVSLAVILGTTMIVLVTGAEVHNANVEKKNVKTVVHIDEIETVKEVKQTDRTLTK